MTLLLLTNLASPHSIKWVRGLSGLGHRVVALSLSPYDPAVYADLADFHPRTLGLDDRLVKTASGRLAKWRYFRSVPLIRQLIRQYRPDLVHAHRATSYGLLGVMAGARPLIVSVWGDDVYLFPRRGFPFAQLLRFVLRRADRVLSTSHVMARETARYTSKPIAVTPFGIDPDVFTPREVADPDLKPPGTLLFGTIKTLEEKYGIDYLIRAFAGVCAATERPVRLLIIGTGSRRVAYEALAAELGVADRVIFLGRVPFDRVPFYHNLIDVFVALSVFDAESFGVSIVEASATATPVVVSAAGGPAEVVEHERTGYVVPMRDAGAAAGAMLKLLRDPALRQRLGAAGRAHVEAKYDWRENLHHMHQIYQSTADA